MAIVDGMKWLTLAGAALVLGGCVAAPPPGAYQPVSYTDPYGEPVYAYEEPVPYDAASATTVYQPVPVYDDRYYAPVYPVTTSFGFGIYDYGHRNRNRYYDRDRRGPRNRGANRRGLEDRPLRAERRNRLRNAAQAPLTAEEREAIRAERREANQEARQARRNDRRVPRNIRSDRGTVDAAALLRRFDRGERSRSREN